MDFFFKLDIQLQIALIAACGGLLVALINGVFSLIGRKKHSDEKKEHITITQSTSGQHNSFIGIQTNDTKEN